MIYADMFDSFVSQADETVVFRVNRNHFRIGQLVYGTLSVLGGSEEVLSGEW